MSAPVDDSEIFIDKLIQQIQLHLKTVGGMYITTALLPPSPTPSPGFKEWIGYTIPPATPMIPPQEDEITSNTEVELSDSPELTVNEEIIADFATDNGYSISESIGIAKVVGPDIISGKASLNNLSNIIPPNRRNIEPIISESVLTENITECGNVKLPTPNSKLILAMKRYGIITPLQRAHFLAQCAHESGGFRWKTEFASGASYEGRKTLGNIYQGDGRKYKGRGLIQLTGRANYTEYNKFVEDDILTNPELVATKYAEDVAAWFWKTRKLNSLANDSTMLSLVKITKRVNGGVNGLDDRRKYFCGYWKKLQENPKLYT